MCRTPTESDTAASAIRGAQSELFKIDRSVKSLYMLFDEYQLLEERGQLSADVVKDLGAVLREELVKVGNRISRTRIMVVCSMFTGEIPSIGNDGPEQ